MSETCSWMLTLTRQSGNLRNRSKLNLDNKKVKAKDLSYAHLSTSFRWKTICLTVDDWDENELQHIKRVIFGSDTIQSLILSDPGWDWYELEPDPTKPLSGEELTEVLCQAPNLKSLSLTIEVLIRISPKRLTTRLQERLSALENLRILWVSDNVYSEQKVATVCESIRVLSKVPKMRLRRFRYEYWNTAVFDLPNYPSTVSPMIEFMERHQYTLEDLALDSDEIWNSEDMAGRLRFPILKVLSVRALKFQAQEGLAKFLERQPFLESLHIQCQQPNLELFRAIHRRSTNLKAFSFNTFTSHIERAEVADWSFLRELGFLKRVRLCQPFFTGERRKSMREVMDILPASLESAKIIGVAEGDWSDENPHLHIIPCFSRLRNLTKLNFLGSWNSITDVALQCICSTYLNQLLELEFEKCDEVTEFGITGRRENEDTGISLRNLKS